MIDWVTAKLPFYAKGIIAGGHILRINADGEQEWSLPQMMLVTGSYDARISIKTTNVDVNGDTCEISLSGNPVKFLQGHNLYGSNDLLNLVYDSIEAISRSIDCPQPDWVLDQISRGEFTVSRIDINRMYSLGNKENALEFLAQSSQVARTRNGTAVTKGSTVYFNKNSKRWSIKQYYKAEEVQANLKKSKSNWEMPRDLANWLIPIVRTELTLKSKELEQRNLRIAANWVNIDTDELFDDYHGRIVMAKQVKKQDLFLEIQKESRPLAATYQLWLHGHDVQTMLTKRTFYRHRKQLLAFDVDISIPCPPDRRASKRDAQQPQILTPVPVEPPAWVYGTPYYYEPKKRCITSLPH